MHMGRRCVAIITICLGFAALEKSYLFGQGGLGLPDNSTGPFTGPLERRRAEQDLRLLPLKLRERREKNLTDPKIRKQMNDDFIAIQNLRARMVKVFVTGGLVDPDTLEVTADEVKKRASRLRSMLALTEESSSAFRGSKLPSTIESANDIAFKLCIEISRFTENPLFKANGVYTVQYANEADQTLDRVIFLGSILRKGSAKIDRN